MSSIVFISALIMSLPSTGKPGQVAATEMADAFIECEMHSTTPSEINAYVLTALAKTESGFRPHAIRKSTPRMLGLFQLNERFLPAHMRTRWRDIPTHVNYWCTRLLPRWARYHAKHCKGKKHPVLAHHFGGYRISPRAVAVSRKVMALAKRLRASVTH